MDIHAQDPFSEVNVLERIVHRPFQPRHLTNALRPTIKRSFTSDFALTASDGTIRILDYTARGTPLPQNVLPKRRMNKIPIPRFGEGFTVNTEERRDVATVAMDGQIEASQTIVDRHLESVNANMDATEENQLTQAVRGFITDKSGNIVVDLFDELGATQAVHQIDVTDPKPWIRQLQGAKSLVDDNLTGDVTPSYLLLCGSEIGAWLESDSTFIQAQTADTAFRLSLEDNRGTRRLTSDTTVLPARRGYFEPDEAYLVPNIPGFFTKMLGPSDDAKYEGQVLERYVSREALRHGRGWEFEITEFCLQYARKPGAIIRLDFQGIAP